jgi:protein gp37
MGADTKIQWTHHTFNPWWGCTEVSPACDHCYAKAFAHRLGMGLWGKGANRRFFGDKHWNEPLKWNRVALKAGERHRVFCASMADVFEDRDDLKPHRERLWNLIENTPSLDWLLLTKRPSNIARFTGHGFGPPMNVWFGTTVEDRRNGIPRIDVLRKLPYQRIRFLSIEPLIEDLGDVDLRGIDWVILGGESGHGARPFEAAWVRKLIIQARSAGAAPFVKQFGARPLELDALTDTWPQPGTQFTGNGVGGYFVHLRDKKGGTPEEWPEDLRVREFPRAR